MPLPILLVWGAAAALAATGVAKGVTASGNFERAKNIGQSAEKKYSDRLRQTDANRTKTQKSLETLGRLKVQVFTSDIKYLVDALKKARSKLSGFDVEVTMEEIKEYERLVLKSLEIEKGLASGATGGALAAIGAYGAVGTLASASTGAAISGLSGVAASNATLAWLGGGALSVGGYGMAGGMIALGGIVLGPALAIGGFLMAGRAEQALTKAHGYSASVDTAIGELDVIDVQLAAIKSNATELSRVIRKLSQAFNKVKVPSARKASEFERMIVVGKSLKDALDIAVMSKSGNAAKGLKSKTSGLLQVAGPKAAT